MATKRRKVRKTRKRSCKNGKLKKPVRTKSGGKRKCKKRKTKKRKTKKKSRKYKMRSLQDMSRDSIRRSEMLQNIPGGYERRREIIRSLPNRQSMLLEELMPAQLSDMPDEMLLEIFQNNSLNELGRLYKTNNRRLRGIVLFIVKRKYNDNEKVKELIEESGRGNINTVRMLLDAGTDVNASDYDGNTALMFANINGHTEIVELLLNAGANPNIQTHDGDTALMLASQSGYTEIVIMLLDAGADPNIQINPFGRDPENALTLARNAEIVQLLENAGATLPQIPVFGGALAPPLQNQANFNQFFG